jgi:hypothetical protein
MLFAARFSALQYKKPGDGRKQRVQNWASQKEIACPHFRVKVFGAMRIMTVFFYEF